MTFNRRTRPNKYGAKKCEYGGYIYDSRKEADYAQELDLRVKALNDPLVSWERQVAFRFYLIKQKDKTWQLVCNPDQIKTGDIRLETYYLDFVEHNEDGTKCFTEVKGAETTTWRRKWRLLLAFYGSDPNIETLIIK